MPTMITILTGFAESRPAQLFQSMKRAWRAMSMRILVGLGRGSEDPDGYSLAVCGFGYGCMYVFARLRRLGNLEFGCM